MKNLILIDDHKMLRKGISSYFTENSDWTIFAEAESLDEVPAIIKKAENQDENLKSFVAVVDIQIKGENQELLNGFCAIKILSEHRIPSVVFSSHDSGASIERAMSHEVGARGFVSKLSDEKILLDAVNTVLNGQTFIQPDLVSSLLEVSTIYSALTRREMEVLKLIQDGLSNQEIANLMKIKLSTLENYLCIIYDKTGSRDKASLLEKIMW